MSELAEPYAMSFAAIAKHVSVLEKAGLITKRRNGKQSTAMSQEDRDSMVESGMENGWRQSVESLGRLVESCKVTKLTTARAESVRG